jgi:GNAT superfamily N-acetyltransferase
LEKIQRNAGQSPILVHRVASEADFRRLRELFILYEADLAPKLRHGHVPQRSDLKKLYVAPNAAFLALYGEDAIGCVAVKKRDPETAVLLRLFVQPSKRGLGAARALVSAVIGYARQQRYRRIVLDTHREKLMPAYRLYRSFGFEECEPFATVSYECPTFMELRLEEALTSPRGRLADDRI